MRFIYILIVFLFLLLYLLSKVKRHNYIYTSAAIISIILIRTLILDIGQVSSNSMANTINKKDWIVINKITYGISLPVSLYEIPWLSYLSNSMEKDLWNSWRNKKRIIELSKINQGDIVVFRLPTNTKRQVIK